ncbi:hypothetical protein EUTSA_v10021778mg [Eutrema salsugineum]|uniref:Uncharacterized protein n=1 Tax=Eutrema salsugineum TaxID=72664 RepID=V4M0C4_EUTSA|nr:uncharacterized protein LOC18024031 [Eutrema salsugineum]ESQ49519.1 hypothetical protein EUTSA_v10021778mg [Eutrema salsugineum]
MMRAVRSFIAQYYRRGKSCDPTSSRSHYSDVDPIKSGHPDAGNLLLTGYLLDIGIGLASGCGIAALMFGNQAGESKRIEEDWKNQQLKLDGYEKRMDLWKYFCKTHLIIYFVFSSFLCFRLC